MSGGTAADEPLDLTRGRVVVVGASLAGVHAAAALRRDGFTGPLSVVDAQVHPPYDRPPLSKEFLTGRFDTGDLALRVATDLDVAWHPGTIATGVDLDARTVGVTSASGTSELAFDGLVIACGAGARTLPGTEGVPGVQVLRTLDDATALRTALDDGLRSVVVVGAGFIGLEVAASCRERGASVTVVESASQPLERVLGPEAGGVVAAVHEANGVDLRLGEGVSAVEAAGPVPGDLGVVLSSGSVVTGERVVVGIGVAPATAWLEGSGLEIDNGVVCDATLSAAPGVVAAGDILRWPSHRYGQLLRVEHWDHAVASGEAAAARLLAGAGAAAPFDPVPFFWSHQYDMKMQLVGLGGSDAEAVLVGDSDEGRLVVVYGRRGSTTGVLGINRPRHVALLREAVAAGAPVEEVVATAEAL